MVVEKTLYSVQDFFYKFFGFTICPRGEKNELRQILNSTGHKELRDYPLDKIEIIVKKQIPVVLVDTTYINDHTPCEMVHEYRWVEVPSKA